jgi:alpha-1,2-glucosyltransferase
MSALYPAFCAVCVTVLKEVNRIIDEPYMVCISNGYADEITTDIQSLKDEPFHVPQAQAFCRGEYSTWDPKITTPPGL